MRAQSPLLDGANHDLENNEWRNVLSGRRLKLRDFYTNYLSNCSLCFRLCTYQGLFLNCYFEKPLASSSRKMYREMKRVKNCWLRHKWVSLVCHPSQTSTVTYSLIASFETNSGGEHLRRYFFLRKYLRNDRFSITILRVWYMYIPPYFEHWVR